ncbi:MAG TPA: hypothetical protein VN903_27765, partial [Polyangia bacterium]|nr:hypothetical protein [Polyangia bacterium]
RGGTGGGAAGTGGGAAGTGGGAAGTGGGAAGTGGGAAGTGGGAAGTGGGTGGTGTGGTGTACVETNPPAAIAAACASCIAVYATPNEGCCNLATLDATGFTLCQAASSCMRTGGAPVGKCNLLGDTSTCYCGTNPSTCDSGDANGPCLNQVTAAAGRNVTTMTTDTPTPSQVVQRFGDTDYALGRASVIHSYAGAFCPDECGL